ncbi:MAG: hypothetical protein JW807_09545 [Spirochaetes bacterium]|nr:hypothetical protein [Spirochaetota bacterium]
MTVPGKRPPLRLIPFDTSKIFNILVSRQGPLMELDLLRLLTGRRFMPQGRERLFELHFSLYHALYRLKYEAGEKGFYLHLDPARIGIARTPGAGSCRHYFPESASFCRLPAEDGACCAGHREPGGPGEPSFDPLLEFYSNEENLSFGTTRILGRLIDGVIIYALKRGEVERALRFFGLPRPTLKNVKKKYHELARAYHPDLNGGDDALMKELNHSYQVLMEVFVI